jgi:hypothetical protein
MVYISIFVNAVERDGKPIGVNVSV